MPSGRSRTTCGHRQLAGGRFRGRRGPGQYIVDFVCFERKLVVELDGGQHAQAEQATYDQGGPTG